MRGIVLAVSVVAACGFAPATSSTSGSSTDGAAASSDTMAGAGSGSGSGSGCPDSDGDGICDSVDDWPCGAKPADPGSSNGRITLQGSYQATSIKLQNQDSRLAVVAVNQTVAIGFGYTVSVLCSLGTTCHAILEDGTDKGGKQGCVFDGSVTGNGIGVGTGTGTYNTTTSFATANRYEIRLMPAKTSTCGSSWAGSAPDSNETIAYVCVH